MKMELDKKGRTEYYRAFGKLRSTARLWNKKKAETAPQVR